MGTYIILDAVLAFTFPSIFEHFLCNAMEKDVNMLLGFLLVRWLFEGSVPGWILL